MYKTVFLVLNLMLFTAIFQWLVLSNHWTRGKKAVVALVGSRVIVYTLAVFKASGAVPEYLFYYIEVGSVAFTFFVLLYVYGQLRGGDDRTGI